MVTKKNNFRNGGTNDLSLIHIFYQGITILQAYDAMKGMVAVHKLLLASSPAKRWVVLTGMKAVGRYEGLHGLSLIHISLQDLRFHHALRLHPHRARRQERQRQHYQL